MLQRFFRLSFVSFARIKFFIYIFFLNFGCILALVH